MSCVAASQNHFKLQPQLPFMNQIFQNICFSSTNFQHTSSIHKKQKKTVLYRYLCFRWLVGLGLIIICNNHVMPTLVSKTIWCCFLSRSLSQARSFGYSKKEESRGCGVSCSNTLVLFGFGDYLVTYPSPSTTLSLRILSLFVFCVSVYGAFVILQSLTFFCFFFFSLNIYYPNQKMETTACAIVQVHCSILLAHKLSVQAMRRLSCADPWSSMISQDASSSEHCTFTLAHAVVSIFWPG